MGPKIAIALLATVIVSSFARAQPQQTWLYQFGTGKGDFAEAISPDGAGGFYLAGVTEGELGGPLIEDRDVWIARHDGAGRPLWIRQFSDGQNQQVTAIAGDNAGGFYACGYCAGTLSYGDIWLARYDGAGERLWFRELRSSGADAAHALAPDGAGGIFVAGETGGALGGPSAGGIDAWLARYNASGEQIWIHMLGTIGRDRAYFVVSDGVGGVFVGGDTSDALGGVEIGISDAWLSRYDGSGGRAWIQQFGTTTSESARAAAPDGSGGVFLVGTTTGNFARPPVAGRDNWVARFDRDGRELWRDQFGGFGGEDPYGAAPDGNGGVYIGGLVVGHLFGPSKGNSDAYLARYGADGAQLWGLQFGGRGHEHAHALAGDGTGAIFAAGTTTSELAGSVYGSWDAWVARFADTCHADCDRDGEHTFLDFLCFQDAFATGAPEGDCDADGLLTFFDLLCFQDRFVLGCP
jgi:hypothetical protein